MLRVEFELFQLLLLSMKSGNYIKKKVRKPYMFTLFFTIGSRNYLDIHLVLDFSLQGNLPALGFFSEEEHLVILVFYSNFKVVSSLRLNSLKTSTQCLQRSSSMVLRGVSTE